VPKDWRRSEGLADSCSTDYWILGVNFEAAYLAIQAGGW